jgi:hypothetical protein
MEETGLESVLDAAFGGGEPPKAPAPAPENPAAEVAQEEQVEEQALETQAEEAPEEPSELAIEVEVDGQKEVVTGNDRIKELVQKGLHYGRNSEVNARAREQLAAQAQMQQMAAKFQTEVMGDVAQLQALENQLQQWERLDLAAEFEKDMFQAMRLKEQRDQLREKRNTLRQQLELKANNFKQGQAQAAQQLMQAEMNVLLAKLPEWRNSEKAQSEKEQLKTYLASHGYTAPEIENVLDHRFILLARDAYKYRQLQQGKSEKLNQARQAPPAVKPGTKQPPRNDKAEFAKFRQNLKRAGREGNHRAQENAITALFERTFK